MGLTEYIGARDDAGIEIDNNKASGRALFVIDGDHASHFILANKNGTMGIVKPTPKFISFDAILLR